MTKSYNVAHGTLAASYKHVNIYLSTRLACAPLGHVAGGVPSRPRRGRRRDDHLLCPRQPLVAVGSTAYHAIFGGSEWRPTTSVSGKRCLWIASGACSATSTARKGKRWSTRPWNVQVQLNLSAHVEDPEWMVDIDETATNVSFGGHHDFIHQISAM